ncbi:hypothetical protein [Micromonospora zamorensis]|uniref:hypothetical protein n=1 Tax=Micromonospora zamorensis TaxID=709883 RepID=UPI002E2A1876|nr:hypothetical protein [Micromonospora zamorensis]
MSPFAPNTCGTRASPLNPASAQSGSDPVSTRAAQPAVALAVAAVALAVAAVALAVLAAELVGAAAPPLVVVVHPASRTTDDASTHLPQETISPLPVRVDDSSYRHDTGRARQVPWNT